MEFTIIMKKKSWKWWLKEETYNAFAEDMYWALKNFEREHPDHELISLEYA